MSGISNLPEIAPAMFLQRSVGEVPPRGTTQETFVGTIGTTSSIRSCREKFLVFDQEIRKRHADPIPILKQDNTRLCLNRDTVIDYRIEREKKHFPHLLNQSSDPQYAARGRKYMPHGYGDDYSFRPHSMFIQPEYTDCGPDWTSRLRYIPSPHTDDYPAEENWPEPWKSLRTYPWMSLGTEQEWLLHPEGYYDTTLRCSFGGLHQATHQSKKELTSSIMFGKSRTVYDRRNGLPMAAPGDKNYQVAEYSPHFHKMGSTLPVVNFGGNGEKSADTFVPLQPLPPIERPSFQDKEKERLKVAEIKDVQQLETWRPATPLQAPPPPPQPQQSHSHQYHAQNHE